MNQEVLNNLAVGEKVVDIQEYYYGTDGRQLVYKVTVYTRKKLLFLQYISKYTFPFYFATKKLAEEYMANYDNYKISEEFNTLLYNIKPKNIKKSKLHYKYRLSKYDEDYNYLPTRDMEYKEVWGGYVNFIKNQITYGHKYYTEIENIEGKAAKEGTTGQTFSYKLQEV